MPTTGNMFRNVSTQSKYFSKYFFLPQGDIFLNLYSLENTVIEEEYKDKREGKGRRCYLGDGTLAIFHQDDTKKDE